MSSAYKPKHVKYIEIKVIISIPPSFFISSKFISLAFSGNTLSIHRIMQYHF
jgi:hypothetical protein